MNDRQKLLFVCAWGHDRKKSWSGTHYGIYSALQSYFDIQNIDIGKYNGSIYSYLSKLRKLTNRLLHKKSDMECADLAHYRKVIQNKWGGGRHFTSYTIC